MFRKANYIYTLYREGSFTKAADKLYISQPCLSAAVKQIEQKIGGKLFDRTGAAVKPTELGLRYIRTAEQILRLEAEFCDHLDRLSQLETGTLRVGGSNYVCAYILPRILDAFSKKYPGITATITEASSAELDALMEGRNLDLVIDSFDGDSPRHTTYPLLQEKILLVVPADLPCNELLTEKAITPAALYDNPEILSQLEQVPLGAFRNEKFILLKSGNSMYAHAMDIFRAADLVPDVQLYMDQLSTSYYLASQGNGCCFVTDTVFRYHRFQDAVLIYHVEHSKERSLAIAHRKGERVTPAAEAFIQAATASF